MGIIMMSTAVNTLAGVSSAASTRKVVVARRILGAASSRTASVAGLRSKINSNSRSVKVFAGDDEEHRPGLVDDRHREVGGDRGQANCRDLGLRGAHHFDCDFLFAWVSGQGSVFGKYSRARWNRVHCVLRVQQPSVHPGQGGPDEEGRR